MTNLFERETADARDFERERDGLKVKLRQFCEGGEGGCTRHPHPFFGSLTPEVEGLS
jgi:hypothetical protein